MSLRHLADTQLLANMKTVVAEERQVLTKVLHHLREIERRRLFADLGYGSLFDYAVNELKYSEGHASRRIAAMRMLKEIPEIEESLTSGELSLSNLCQAHSLFRHQKKQEPDRAFDKTDKLNIIDKLKNKTTREGQRELFKLSPREISTRTFEKERVITEDASEVRFLMSDDLKEKLQAVKALLGPKAAGMGYAELIETMAELSQQKLAENKFGKKRSAPEDLPPEKIKTPAPLPDVEVTSQLNSSTNPRYIPQAVKHAVWQRDGGCCTNCKSRNQLNFDHIHPVALGGTSTLENLRLLCFSCNQRQAIKSFGLSFMEHKTPPRAGESLGLKFYGFTLFVPRFTRQLLLERVNVPLLEIAG